MAHRAVFLDRDNTLIYDPGYLSHPAAVRLLPDVGSALKRLADAGFKLALVTNQSAVARGLVTEQILAEIHAELQRLLRERSVCLDAIYCCPYHPEGTVEPFNRESDERKPNPGMLLRAAREMDIDLAASWMVGDTPRDMEAGRRAGCRTVLVAPHQDALGDETVQADFTVPNLADAADVILRSGRTKA